MTTFLLVIFDKNAFRIVHAYLAVYTETYRFVKKKHVEIECTYASGDMIDILRFTSAPQGRLVAVRISKSVRSRVLHTFVRCPGVGSNRSLVGVF